jgi:hypothetical protein
MGELWKMLLQWHDVGLEDTRYGRRALDVGYGVWREGVVKMLLGRRVLAPAMARHRANWLLGMVVREMQRYYWNGTMSIPIGRGDLAKHDSGGPRKTHEGSVEMLLGEGGVNSGITDDCPIPLW